MYICTPSRRSSLANTVPCLRSLPPLRPAGCIGSAAAAAACLCASTDRFSSFFAFFQGLFPPSLIFCNFFLQNLLTLLPFSCIIHNCSTKRHADVAELADALDSGSSDSNVIWVQVPSSAPKGHRTFVLWPFFYATPHRSCLSALNLAAAATCVSCAQCGMALCFLRCIRPSFRIKLCKNQKIHRISESIRAAVSF